MKGWLILGLLIGGAYYLYNNTDFFDEQKAEAQTQYNQLQSKVKSMTGTQVIKSNDWIGGIKNQFKDRMSKSEFEELELIISGRETISDFKDNFCEDSVPTHPVFSRENTRLLCDTLPDET